MDVVKQAVDLGRSCDSVVCLAITTLTLNLWSFILIAPLLLCRCWLRCVTSQAAKYLYPLILRLIPMKYSMGS